MTTGIRAGLALRLRRRRMIGGMAFYRWIARHYIPVAYCFGFAMAAALVAVLPILLARG